MKLTGKIESVSLDRTSRKPIVTLKLDRDSDELDDLMSRESLSIEIKPYHPKRSLNANAYAWVLIDKLAQKLNIPPELVYRKQIEHMSGVCEIVRCRDTAVKSLTSAWQSHGLGWMVKAIGDKGGWTNCILYYGSSTYNTEQMGRFINLLVDECKEQGIDVMSERKRSLLIEKWNA